MSAPAVRIPASTTGTTSLDLYRSKPADKLRISGRALRYACSYTFDRLRGKKTRDLATIPTDFSSVTTDWFGRVLCTGTPGAVVEAFELGVGHNGTSGRQQYLLTYNDIGEAAGLPRSVFAKGTPNIATRISMGTVPSMEVEARFYQRIRPELDIEAPVGYFSDYDLQTGRSIHLLEDLTATRNATFPGIETEPSRSQAENIVEVLASLHGHFYEDPRLDGEWADLLSWPEMFGRMCRLMDLEKYHRKGFEKAQPFIPKSLWDRRREVWPAIVRSTELHRQLPKTLVHGDVHIGNWYITGESRMGLLDWQCVSRGHWSRDVAYALSATLPVDKRREWEEPLLTYYLQLMADRTGQTFGFDEAWRLYRQQIFGALAFWTPTYSPPFFAPRDMQPETLSQEMIRRFATAIADLHSLDSFV